MAETQTLERPTVAPVEDAQLETEPSPSKRGPIAAALLTDIAAGAIAVGIVLSGGSSSPSPTVDVRPAGDPTGIVTPTTLYQTPTAETPAVQAPADKTPVVQAPAAVTPAPAPAASSPQVTPTTLYNGGRPGV